MHIGSLRVAVLSYIVAQQQHKPFIVRIEDTDKARNIPGMDEEIMLILEKFALKHDQRKDQSESFHIHQTLAIRLLEEQKAFICTCPGEKCSGDCGAMSSGELAKLKEEKTPFVLRVVSPAKPVTVEDMIRGKITAAPGEVESFVILDANGIPTHDFATACDDMLGGIDTVIRDEDEMGSTLREEYIKELLGYETPTLYLHLPNILNNDGVKISGDDDAGSLLWLFSQGFLPDAILNYLIALGSETPKEVFTLPEALMWFDPAKISRSPIQFDLEQLRHSNREHIRMMDDKKLSSVFGFADADIGMLAKLYLGEASTISEIEPKIKAIFSPKDMSGEYGGQMKIISDIIFDAKPFRTFDELQAHIAQKSGLSGEALTVPLRLLLTGTEEGPEPGDIYPYIKSYILEIAS